MINYLQLVRNIVGPMIDAMPHPVFLVDEKVAIVGLNSASEKFIGRSPDLILRKPAGEVLHCLHAIGSEKGCGHSSYCKDCVIRQSVAKAFSTGTVSRKKIRMEMLSDSGTEEIFLSIIASPFDYEDDSFVLLQLENITELMELRKLVPICSVCHDIRVDGEYWQKIESFMHKHFNLNFTHGLCPECLEKNYGNEDWYQKIEKKFGSKKHKKND